MDRRLKPEFNSDFTVITVAERGWSGTRNGELLRLADAEFDVLVTMDQGIQHQQNLGKLQLSIVVISARSNRRQDVALVMPEVNKVLMDIQKGMVVHCTTRNT